MALEVAPKDVISSMPDNVVTNIMDRLPIQDAVRTGILSRNWRFKWTMLSQLVFDKNFFEYILERECENKYGIIISRLLLHLKGAIKKFVLSIDEQCYSELDIEDINHWIFFLSRNGTKELTITKRNGPPLMLPTHLFSCLELKHLKLFNCCFHPPTSFHGFPNLLSFALDLVPFESSELGKLITRCPLLKSLNMRFWRPVCEILNMNVSSKGKMKLVEIAKLANLKILYLSLCCLDDMKVTTSSSILELVGFLPKLQILDLDFIKCKVTGVGAKRRSSTVFPNLKDLNLSRMDLGNGFMLSCAFELIMSFPNLQTLKATTNDWDVPKPASCSPEVDYNIMGLLQLRSVVVRYCKASENELCLIKYLLACSPSLKKIAIIPHLDPRLNEKFMFARKLLKVRPASPIVDIDLQ